MSMDAELKVPFDRFAVFYVHDEGEPDKLGPSLKELVDTAKNMKGSFNLNLERVFYKEREEPDSVIDSTKHVTETKPQHKDVDYIYRIDENGKIEYKVSGGRSWSTYE